MVLSLRLFPDELETRNVSLTLIILYRQETGSPELLSIS